MNKKKIKRALADDNLQLALRRFTALTKLGRQFGMTGIDFEALRQDLHTRKEKCIEDQPDLIDRFKANAASAGACIYEAADAEDAQAYVLKTCKEHAIKHIVKSKSMLTEEISLREHLENNGIKVDETDIGERVVQLAGERPVHIVGPAIHKTVEQIADLFTQHTGKQVSTDSQELLDTVRRSLRQSYLDADMGISGANIGIAETGTLVILTNEGNGQIVTTLPPVHIALVGIEKLVHDFADANAVLRLLSRSCVGTKMTVYTSFITGTSHSGAVSGVALPGGQGPRELHIVLVDNGRRELRASAEFREALYCIKCGACLNVCPVFASVSGHVYGHIYQGGIGTILTAFFHDAKLAGELSEMCMGCLACKSVCPSGIDIPRLMLDLKNRLVSEEGLSLIKKIAYRDLLKYPHRIEGAVKACSILQRPFIEPDSIVRKLPYPLNGITDAVSLPGITANPLLKRMKGYSLPAAEGRPKIAFFSGCVTAFAYPEIGESVINIFNRLEAAPYYPVRQSCCGAPAYFSGDRDTALHMARHNIEELSELNPEYIVTVCPGCAVMLKNEYPKLVKTEPGLYSKAVKLAAGVCDFSQLCIRLGQTSDSKAATGEKVTYHDPCHLKRGLNIFAEPRQLIKQEGYQLIEMNDADACCGFGGDALLTHPELCGSILERKLANIEATGADTVVTACTACVLQLRGGLDKRKSPVKVLHIAELMARG